jgi:hypothetical protein
LQRIMRTANLVTNQSPNFSQTFSRSPHSLGPTAGAWALPARPSTSPSQRYCGGTLAAVIVTTTASGKQKLRCWCRGVVPSNKPTRKSLSGLRSLPLPSLIAGRETPRVTFMYTMEGVQVTGVTRCWPTPAVGMEGGADEEPRRTVSWAVSVSAGDRVFRKQACTLAAGFCAR